MIVRLNEQFSTPYEKMNFLRYAKDGNTVITKKINVQNIGGNFYATEAEIKDSCNYETRDIFVFYPSIEIGVYLCRIYKDSAVDLPECMSTLEKLRVYLDELAERGEYIQLIYIEIIKKFAPERVPNYIKAREAYCRKQLEKERRLEAQKTKAYYDEVKEINILAEKQEKESICIIEHGGRLENSTIKFAQIGEDGYPKTSSTCILLHLLKKYGISVPIKTQGWINNSLYSITVSDNQVISIYRKRQSTMSHTALVCLNKLCDVINESKE